MDIDVSKENIQPLRGGRNLTQLGAALQAQSDGDVQRQLQQQKEEFEAAIRNYQGNDPLEPWFCYIQWVEQSFPKHGHEGHLDKLIKDCLQMFEKDERYYQDRRFIKLWIKYIDCLSNPLEIYQRLYNSGIGIECSEFYRAWAYYCEDSEDFKKANQVYMLGLQAQAQPLDELEQAHMNFQLYFAQRMLHDDSPTKRKAASALAETRLALTSLKSFKRRNVATAPVQRTGESVKSIIPGVVKQTGGQTSRQGSNVMLSVYEDAASSSQAPIPVNENPGPASLVQAFSNIENEKEVGIWTSAKIQMVHANVVPHQPLPFTPYEDEEDVLRLPSNHKPYCEDDLVFPVPLCVPDPPDPTKIPRYNKEQVYVDDKEYSLEEIRSRKYNLKVNIKTESDNVKEEQNSFNQSLAQCSALETLANCALDTEQDHLAQLMPLNIPTHITKVTNMHSPGEPKVLVNLDSKELSQLAGKKHDENHENQKPVEDKENLARPSTSTGYSEGASNNFARNNLAEEFNKSLLNNLHGDITMNTKEARWELRNIFNDNEPTMIQPIIQAFDVPKFDIHEDRSMTMALNTQHKQMLQNEMQASPQDKENANANKVPNSVILPPNANKTVYYEEPSCTQMFNFNIKDASTPNMSQFKKPNHIDHSKSVPKFSIDESEMESEKKDEISRPETRMEQQSTDNQGAGLSVIMEATREYNSKSGSSSSGQSTRGNFTGYTTPYSEKTHGSNYDSMYNQDPTASKRNSTASQPRLANGRFAPAYPQPRDDKVPQAAQYLSHDHQYQKPLPQNYNYQAQRMHPQYQQNYQYPQAYNNQATVPQGFQSPNAAYHSPQHPGMQSPVVQPGFQSPPYAGQQIGYHSPGHIMSPQHVYHYPNQVEPQHVYAPQQSPGFQSPPHQTQYQQNVHYYQRPSQNVPTNHVYNQQGYHGMPNQYNNQMYHHQNVSQNHPNMAQNQSQHPMAQNQSPHHNMNQTQHHHNMTHNQSPHQNANLNQTQHVNANLNQSQHASANLNQSQHHQNASQNHYVNQNQYGQQPRQVEKVYNAAQSQPFQIYQSPQPNQNSYQETHEKSVHQPMQTSPDMHVIKQDGRAQKQEKKTLPVKPASQKSPTAALRSVRHDLPNVKPTPPDVGFSNQFLNFISNRNEPKDNANTPKFSNSPNISQKMHKNLYVSSPEQAQIPPSSGLSDSDSKDGLTAQTITPIQSAKIAQMDKSKDISKRQLDFEQRDLIQSEDSRDSMGKETRISAVYSRHSDFHSDGYGMDVDSENSMECNNYKSNHSISMIETSEIPKPADIDFPKVIDPFNKKIIQSLLEYVQFPNKTHAEGYFEVRYVPKLQVASNMTIGNSRYAVEKQLGKGNYGAVFLCTDMNTNRAVAVKYQKPSRPWEFYICQEIKARIKDPCMFPGYMDITTAYLADNASLFISEYSKYGSLLDVANKVKVGTTKCINEHIVFLLTSEMLSIVHYLHKAQIIHADIKPDNFLLMNIPTQEWRTPSLQLIDLGCSIDMSLFPENTTFRELIATEGFTCTEMREGKPWTYQTDLYCLAGTIHVILMGSYMKVANRLGQWNIDKKLPRYMKISTWDKIFTTLLNVPDCNNLPDLMDLKNDIELLLRDSSQVLTSQLRTFANVLKSR